MKIEAGKPLSEGTHHGVVTGTPVERMLRSQRVIIVIGAGGVGKTTSSVALAIHAARLGRRVALLSIDPAKRLAAALGIELGHELRPVNFPDAAVVAPIDTCFIVPVVVPVMLIVPLPVKFVNVPAAAELPPIVVPSMLPPLMSAVSVVNVFVDATVNGCPAVINSDPFVVAKFK